MGELNQDNPQLEEKDDAENRDPQADQGEEVRQRPLGELLIESNLVSEEQLSHALRVQSKLKKKKRVGRILIELGYLTDGEMREMLAKYSRKVRFGDLLVEREFISPSDLEHALEVQKREPGQKLGEVLVKEKLLTEKSLTDALALYMEVDREVPEFKKINWELLKKVSLGFLEQHKVLPYGKKNDKLFLLVTPHYSKDAIETVKGVFGLPVELGLATETELETIFQYIRGRPAKSDVRALVYNEKDESIPALLDRFIFKGIEMGASDIHIEPMEQFVRVRYRIDGRLIQFSSFSREHNKALVARAKILSGGDIAEQRNHQDGKAQVSFHGHPVDLRFSFYVSVLGESVVIRILNPVSNLQSLDSLGFSRYNFTRFADEVVMAAAGIVLVTGPTGSGKTTTLYSTLQFQQDEGYKIITVEDPVEYILAGLVQCAVDEKAGRTFSSSLRTIMRQDPDIIVLGEMRDLESAHIAIHASMTGHKVYSTFHTEDAVSALIRLVQMGLEKYLVASTVLSVMSQRLVRRICNFCRESYVPNTKLLRRLGVAPAVLKTHEFQHGKGCEHCLFTGYRGRVPIHELLILEDQVRDCIQRDESTYQVREQAVKHGGMVSLIEDGLFKIFRGHTTFEEVMRSVPITLPPRDINEILKIVE